MRNPSVRLVPTGTQDIHLRPDLTLLRRYRDISQTMGYLTSEADPSGEPVPVAQCTILY
jgi:hypothetical protein